MKPAPFEYHRPSTVDEALTLLADLPGAKVLAGGQSLVPLLNFRLATPSHLVDVSRLDELSALSVDGTVVRVGAAVTHSRVLADDHVARTCPLLREAERHVAHAVIRNRGTLCGSLAHADPAGELTAVLAVLEGTVEARSRDRGVRALGADELFTGPLETALRPDELLTQARFPVTAGGRGVALAEVARRHGDYALAGAAARVSVDGDGGLTEVRLSLFAVGPIPLTVVIDDVAGRRPDELDAGALYDTVTAAVDPEPDLHATADYRRHLAGTTAVDAVGTAARRAVAPAPVG